MELFILYWMFTSIYTFGQDHYMNSRFTFKGVLIGVLTGWFLVPMSLGTKRQSEIDDTL